ncbi:hypothetical protein LIA77_09347 [Sarocladium implicatum]|nr:hypothetical protein LIA77_09347 [Sarocladium implicatum]
MSRVELCFIYTKEEDHCDGHMQIKSRPLPTYIVIVSAAKLLRRAWRDNSEKLLAARVCASPNSLYIDSMAVKTPGLHYSQAQGTVQLHTCGTPQGTYKLARRLSRLRDQLTLGGDHGERHCLAQVTFEATAKGGAR